MLNTTLDLTLLFMASLLAATIFPAQSETALAALHLTNHYNTALLVAVAATGNVLGSCVNWLLGRYLVRFERARWFPVKDTAIRRATRTYRRFGVWSLLLAWVPVIGDPLTVIAGFLKTPFPLFVILVAIGKTARYVALVWAL